MNDTGKRAWLYSRIDAPEDEHGALKMQEKGLREYAGQMGFAIAGTSSDLGSGREFDRPGLARLTAAAREGSYDILLVKSLSRLGRDTAQTFELLRQLDGLGVHVLSPLEGEIRLDEEKWFELQMKLSAATGEAAQLFLNNLIYDFAFAAFVFKPELVQSVYENGFNYELVCNSPTWPCLCLGEGISIEALIESESVSIWDDWNRPFSFPEDSDEIRVLRWMAESMKEMKHLQLLGNH